MGANYSWRIIVRNTQRQPCRKERAVVGGELEPELGLYPGELRGRQTRLNLARAPVKPSQSACRLDSERLA